MSASQIQASRPVQPSRDPAMPAAWTQVTADQAFTQDRVQRVQQSPATLTPADVLALQRTVGNQAVQRLLGERSQTQTPVVGERLATGAVVQLSPEGARPNRSGLPDGLKAGVESLSGLAMDDVKVHYNSSRPARVNAHAYAQGSDIHLAPGQEQHLPHEAWHVVQQRQGRVKATMQMKNMAINTSSALETEADVMGSRAQRMGAFTKGDPSAPIKRLTSLPATVPSSAHAGTVAQMKWVPIVKGQDGVSGARKHYYDGWGEAMGITKDDELIDVVENEGSVEEGRQFISYGNLLNSNEHISKNCNVIFENFKGKKGDDVTTIFHAGPASYNA